MNVRLHWAERFLNWFPHHTKLYLRGERGKDMGGRMALQKELFNALAPFFDALRKEALTEGHKAGLRIRARVFEWDAQTVRLATDLDIPVRPERSSGVIIDVSDAAGNPIGSFQSPLHKRLRRDEADQMVAQINDPATRLP